MKDNLNRKNGRGIVGALLAAVFVVAVLFVGCRQCSLGKRTMDSEPPPPVCNKEFKCSRTGSLVLIRKVPSNMTVVKCRICGEKHSLKNKRENYLYQTEFTYSAERDAP